MLKHTLRYSSLSLALWCAGALAQPISAHPTPAELEYTKFKTQDAGEIQLETGTHLRYEVTQRKTQGNVEIITAKLHDPYLAELSGYQNLIVTLSINSRQMHAFAETSEGHFHLNNTAGDTTRLWEKTAEERHIDDILPPPKPVKSSSKMLKNSAANLAAAAPNSPFDGEKDASGRYVIDVFIGFSTAAAAHLGNIELHAHQYIESVNVALKNSKIDNVYLRLVGTGTAAPNPGVITSVLSDGKIWFKDDIARTAPDLLGLIQMPTAADTAGGWAGVGGDSHVISATLHSAYRHEVGHNAGGIHCKEPTDTGYHYGFSLGQGKGTIQCGNDLAFYSSPLIKDDKGNILGTDHSQDMARVWRERAATMSSNRIHTIPFKGDETFSIIIQAEDYTGFSDSTSGNAGGAYNRNDNVDIEVTSDTNGGFNVGWITSGEWLAYKVTIPTKGKYKVSYRVASLNTLGRMQLEQQGGGKVYGTIDAPVTGGWQNWTTVNHEVELDAGVQSIALSIKTGNFNLNWIKIEKVASPLGVFRLQNSWQPTKLIHIENGVVETGDVPAGYWSSQWIITQVTGTQFVRLTNRWKPTQALYVNAGKLSVGALGSNEHSSHWEIERANGDEYRLKSRLIPDQYINIEGNQLQVSKVQPGWMSARWKLVSN